MVKGKSRVFKEFEGGEGEIEGVEGKIEGGEGKTEGGERPIGQQKNEQRMIKGKT